MNIMGMQPAADQRSQPHLHHCCAAMGTLTHISPYCRMMKMMGMEPGGEFKVALEEADACGAR